MAYEFKLLSSLYRGATNRSLSNELTAQILLFIHVLKIIKVFCNISRQKGPSATSGGDPNLPRLYKEITQKLTKEQAKATFYIRRHLGRQKSGDVRK